MMTIEQTILIVDDHPQSLHVLEVILESENWSLLKATSGVQALALLKQHDVSLVLLDAQLYEMNAFDFVSTMRKDGRIKDIPVIFLSAIKNNEDKNLYKGYQVGAFEYLYKPVNPEILKFKVDCVMRLDYQNRQLRELLIQIEAACMTAHRNEQQGMGQGMLAAVAGSDVFA